MKNLSLLLLFIPFIISCEDEVIKEESKTNIEIFVYKHIGNEKIPVEGASIFTIPKSQKALSDNLGKVVFNDVKPGEYEFFADLSSYGSGKIKYKIIEGENKINIQIIKDLQIDYSPKIKILSPQLPASFRINENIVFKLKITDDSTKYENIQVKITSDPDGVLFQGNPDSNGDLMFETSTLTKAKHKITVSATDKDDITAYNTFNLSTLAPNKPTLDSAISKNSLVYLFWKKQQEADFLKYEIYRANDSILEGELISTITNSEELSFIDNSAPLVDFVFYYIKVYNVELESRNSEKIKVNYPAGKLYKFTPILPVHHPEKNIIYTIYDNRLKMIDYEKYTEKEIILNTTGINSVVIGDNGFGQEIYISSLNSNYIYIYNAESLELTFKINTGLKVGCVATNNKGFIVASVNPNPWWEEPVRTYSRKTGAKISGNPGNAFDNSIIKFIPNTNNIITITQDISPIDMDYLTIDNNGQITNLYDDPYHGDYRLDPKIFKISPNGNYLITGNNGTIYSASKLLTYLGEITSSNEYADFAFNTNGTKIFAATKNTNSIDEITYPDLTKNTPLETKGKPLYLLNFKNKLISLSLIENTGDVFIIEQFDIQ